MALLKANTGIGTTNPTAALHVFGDSIFTGIITATTFVGSLTGTATTASSVTANSVGLGTHTYGDYVKDITGTANQITVTSGTGEGSSPTLSIPNQFTAPQDVTITRDLQVNRNLNVNGNITIGGTSATIFSSTLNIYDPDIVLGYRTDANGNDISTDNTANHGGIAVASTEGNPLVQLFIAGIETNPATYKKIMWFKAGEFAGLATDAWLSNYAIGIGSTQFPSGTRLAAGSIQLSENDIRVVRNINASGIVTASGGFNLGISSTGTTITSGPVKTLNFVGSGNTFAVNGTTVDISISGGGGGVSISTVAPSSPSEGNLWYNSNLGRTFVYYNDGSSSQWVDVAPFNQGGTNSTVTVSSSAPTSPTEGQLWYNTTLARTFIYYADGTSSQWVDAAPFNAIQPEDDTADGKNDTTIIATEGQTVFNVAYQVGYVDVYLNGVRLSQTEFTATNGTQITLTSAASAGDIFDAVEYKKYVIGITTAQYDALTFTKTLTIGTRSTNPGVIPLVGTGMTISLRSGIGTANF